MGERIAVTGASGFVGRHVVAAASARGFEVLGIVRQVQREAIVRDAGGRPIHVHGLHADALARAFKGCAAVVHLAQIGAERAGGTYETTNVAGTRQVVDAAHRAGVPTIVFASGLGVTSYGLKTRCTNRYFLSKLQAEVEIYRSDLRARVFRPSYILGPGSELANGIRAELAAGRVAVVGDGSYRMQPVAVEDAAEAIVVGAVRDPEGRRHRVLDLVGPEPVSYLDLVGRIASLGGRREAYAIDTIATEEAEQQAALGGYRGMLADEFDCMVCDETSDHVPLARLLGRPLASLDVTLMRVMDASAR